MNAIFMNILDEQKSQKINLYEIILTKWLMNLIIGEL